MTADAAEMMRALYRLAPSAVVVIDPDGLIESVNPAATRLFGQDESALTGQRGDILFSAPGDFDKLAASEFGLGANRAEREFTARYRSQGDRIVQGETIVSRIAGPDGDLQAFLLIIRDVSAERTLQARLEASDIQLRAALASANEGAFSLNLQTGLGSGRGFINAFLGLASADAGMRLEQLLSAVDPSMRSQVAGAIDALARSPKDPLELVFPAQRADGERRWLEIRGRVSEFTRDGTPLRISGVIADVTVRRRLEEQLAERERQLANAIDAGSCGVWELDLSSQRATLLGPIRQMLAFEDTDPPDMDIDALVARLEPASADMVGAEVIRLIAGQTELLDVEFPLTDARSGQTRWLKAYGRATRSEGSGTIVAGIFTDVSERRLLEATVEAGEQVLREAIESANDGVWSLRLDTERLRLSGFVVPLFGLGLSEAEVSFEHWLQNAPAADRPRVLEAVKALKSATRMSAASVLDVMFGEFPMSAVDGSTLWLRTRGRIVEWSDEGHPLRLSGTISNVTEEHRLRTELHDSQTLLNDALEAAGEGAWRLDLSTRVVEVTASIAEMMGLPPENARVAYSDWLERVHPEDLPICMRCIKRLLASESDTVDYRVRFLSEKEGWISIHNRGQVRERTPKGDPLIATGFIRDITDRVRTENALSQRDRQIAEAAGASGVGSWQRSYRNDVISIEGSIVAELFEQSGRIDISGADWRARIHPDDRSIFDRVQRANLGGERRAADVEYRVRNRSGEWVWYRATGSVTHWHKDGTPLMSGGVIWNVDAARRADQELEERRSRFERIYRATPAMMHTIDTDARIVEVSDYWLTHLGYEREEVIGRPSVEFLDAESRELAETVNLPHLFKHGRNTNAPYRFVRKDGSTIDVLLSSFLERDQEGKPLRSYAVMTDVTALREAQAKLESSNRELDRFATVASHDLQEPLRKIAAFSSLVNRRYGDRLDEDGRRNLEFLVDAAHRMQRLIDDLLAYSRLASQPIRRDKVDVALVIRQAMDDLDAVISDCDALIETGEMPTVRADSLLLTQVFQNLIGNALKYRSFARPEIDISAYREDDFWVFRISDNGIGLDTRFSDKIFAPFQRLHTHDAYPGTGIGLAIVSQSVERHGGRIWVESEPGSGATFLFTLPVDPPADAAEAPPLTDAAK